MFEISSEVDDSARQLVDVSINPDGDTEEVTSQLDRKGRVLFVLAKRLVAARRPTPSGVNQEEARRRRAALFAAQRRAASVAVARRGLRAAPVVAYGPVIIGRRLSSPVAASFAQARRAAVRFLAPPRRQVLVAPALKATRALRAA